MDAYIESMEKGGEILVKWSYCCESVMAFFTRKILYITILNKIIFLSRWILNYVFMNICVRFLCPMIITSIFLIQRFLGGEDERSFSPSVIDRCFRRVRKKNFRRNGEQRKRDFGDCVSEDGCVDGGASGERLRPLKDVLSECVAMSATAARGASGWPSVLSRG